MSLSGILKNPLINTGQDIELSCIFTAPLTIKSNEPSFKGDSMSLKRFVRKQPAQRWEVNAGVKPQSGSGELAAMLLMAGDSTEVAIRMPQIALLPYTETGIKLNVGTTQGDSYVAIKNAVVGGPVPSLLVGEFIRIQGSNKVYVVTLNMGAGTYAVFPNIIASCPVNSVVYHGGEVTMTAYIDSDNSGNIKFSDGILMDPGALTFIEKL